MSGVARDTPVVVLVLGAVWLASSPARAASYTVVPAGDDGDPGTAAQPWRTLQHAADLVKPGDEVTVEAGAYAGFALCWDPPPLDPTAFVDPRPVTFTARPGVVIDAPNPHGDDGIDLEGCSHVVIQGFEVVGMPRAGLRAVSRGDNAVDVTFRGNYTHDNQVWGLVTSHVDSLLIEGNRVAGSKQQDGVSVTGACLDPVVRGNELFGNARSGLSLDGDLAQGGAGVITGAIVEQNVVHDNGALGGAGIDCEGVQSSPIRNNLIYAEHAAGISLRRGDAAQPARGNVVVSNTVVVAADGRAALELRDGSLDNQVTDDILLAPIPAHGAIEADAASLVDLTSDYNVVVDRFAADGVRLAPLAAWRATTLQDAHSLVATPAALFVGPADYHLLATAPAIGAGTATDAPPEDLDGHSRADGIDIGAYQWCEGCVADAGTSAPADAAVDASSDAFDADDASRDADAASAPATPAVGCGCTSAPGFTDHPGVGLLLAAVACLHARRRPQGRPGRLPGGPSPPSVSERRRGASAPARS